MDTIQDTSQSKQHPLLVTVDNLRQDIATCSSIINNTDSGSGNNVIATAISNINNSNYNNSSQGNNNITTSVSNIIVNSLTSDRNDNNSLVTTPPYTEPLSSTVICIQNGNNHHENYTTQHITPATTSCLVRFRQSCIKFFSKIMGSNNPSEADRYDYYDCKYMSLNVG
uniref:Uncharacterized protein n=1 Tax=Glossina brevipalpis TaxID=37001 RepID=A0A1A9WPM5_9MUSC